MKGRVGLGVVDVREEERAVGRDGGRVGGRLVKEYVTP